MHRLLTYAILSLSCAVSSFAQGGLECNGSIYRVIEKSFEVTTLQKVHLEDDRFALEDLQVYNGHQLNAICFKPDAQSIFGIKYGAPYQLFRINDDLQLDIVKELPLPLNLFFVAGDIMPDGQHMVVLGYGTSEESNVLAIIDLNDPNYATEIVPLKALDGRQSVVCADIAFHPTTGLLYGFDQTSNSMIQIDIQDRSIRVFEDRVYSDDIGVVPSMFFDFDGNLFGFNLTQDRAANNRLFQFDKTNGQAEPKFVVDGTGSQDACSCPYQIEMYQSINNINQYACTEARFTISLINRTSLEQTGLSLIDTFPEGISLKSIDYNPFNSIAGLSQNPKYLSLTDFDLPIGEDSIVFTVRIDSAARLGYYQNQAWLTKSNPDIRSNLTEPLRSDDPTTLLDGDATGFLIDNLTPGVSFTTDVVCEGSILTLNSGILGLSGYEWNTGETSPSIVVDRPGVYEVSLISNCGAGSMEFDVTGAHLEIDLGDDKIIDRNEKIDLIPEVYTSVDIEAVIWNEIGPGRILDCYTCPTSSAFVPYDMGFSVTMINSDGCRTTDEMFVVVEEIAHYFANGFTPNGDGVNDVFFLQSKKDYQLKNFMIHDRWGNRIHIAESGVMNNEAHGWDGMVNGKALPRGVFVWSALVLGFDNQYTEVHGDVTLVR